MLTFKILTLWEHIAFLPWNQEHKKSWMTTVDISFMVYGKIVTIPKGFTTRFKSTPWVLRYSLSIERNEILCFLLHDYLISSKNDYTKRQVDVIFYLMYVSIAGPIYPIMSFICLRLFGVRYKELQIYKLPSKFTEMVKKS